jgi:toxin ParE1/3/4
MGQDRSELMAGLFSFPVGNYVIYYRPIDGGIEVVRVLHGPRETQPRF